MTITVSNNSGATVYYMERKLISYSPNTYGWGSEDSSYNWTNWQASSLANNDYKSFSGDRVAVIFHSSDPSSAINSLSQGDSFSADIALWKYGLQSDSVYSFDTGNGSTHNGGSSTWLGYKGSYNSPVNMTSDTTAPTVSSVAVTSASGALNNTLNAGDTVSVTATFSETVVVNTSGGTPFVTINIGGVSRQASYSSGSNSNALVFTYTIASSETTDTNGISIGNNAISANSGTIQDAAGNNANLSHGAVSDNASFKVDTIVPTIASITSSTDSGSYTTSDSINIQVNFSEPVKLSTGNLIIRLQLRDETRDLTVSNWGSSYVSNVSSTYTVQAGDYSDKLTIDSVSLAAGGATLNDAAGNALSSFSIATSLDSSKTFFICGRNMEGDSLQVTGDGVTSNYIFNSNAHGRYQWDNLRSNTCIDSVPFRILNGGAPVLRGQKSESDSFYTIKKGGDSQQR